MNNYPSTKRTNENIIISERNNPLWERILSFFFYALALGGSVLYFTNFESNLGYIIVGGFIFLLCEGILLFYAFQLSAITAVYFDLDNNQYKKVYDIGFAKLGFWKKLPFIEYISIEYHYGTYEAHLKFLDNNYQILFIADTYIDIFSIVYDTAKQIKVGMYDTVKNNQYWVDLTKDKNELLADIGLYVEPVKCTLPNDLKFKRNKRKITSVQEGQKSLFIRILSAMVFTLGTVYVIAFLLFCLSIYTNDNSYLLSFFSVKVLVVLGYLLVPVLLGNIYLKNLIAVVSVQYDKHHNIYRTVYNYGWVSKKENWKCLPEMDYASMFYNAVDGNYEVVLFDVHKKSINMFNGNPLGETFRLTYELAMLLHIEMLNATDWDNQYWVDLTRHKSDLYQELKNKNR